MYVQYIGVIEPLRLNTPHMLSPKPSREAPPLTLMILWMMDSQSSALAA